MNQKTAVFSVQDLYREGCMTLIHDDVEEREGVINVEVDMRDTSITVTYDDDKITLEQIRDIIRGTSGRCAGHEHTVILRNVE